MSDNVLNQVLNALYEENGYVEYPKQREDEIPPDNPLRQRTGLSEEEVHEAVSHGRRAEMIEDVRGNDGNVSGIRFTSEGFSLTHEQRWREEQQELVESQVNVGRLTAGVTIVLAANAVIQAVATILSTPQLQLPLTVGFSLIGSVVAALLWYLNTRKRVLAKPQG